VLECVDPGFLRSVSRSGGAAHIAFLALTVLNLVGGFLVLGTLAGRRHHDAAGVHCPLLARDVTGMIAVASAALRFQAMRGWSCPTKPACPRVPPSSWSRASFMCCLSRPGPLVA